MPLYEFYCPDCNMVFEEICAQDHIPVCPQCASKRAERKISAPSPQKKGAFPYKPGPVHPLASRMASGNSCPTCPGSGTCGQN